MNALTDLAQMIPDLQGKVAPEEWQARVDLAAAYRLVALFKWDDLVFTHLTAHIPGTAHYLINPYGLMFDEITASSLVKINLQGDVLQKTPFPINPAGFTIHSAVHAARPEVQCVMHTHTLNGVAVSAQKAGVLPISQQSIFVLASIGYHDYEGVALRDDEKPRLVADLAENTFLMLRNHGLLTVGASIADAFQAMYFFEATCAIQLRAQAGARDPVARAGRRQCHRRRTDAGTSRDHPQCRRTGARRDARCRRIADLARAAAPARPDQSRLSLLTASTLGLAARDAPGWCCGAGRCRLRLG